MSTLKLRPEYFEHFTLYPLENEKFVTSITNYGERISTILNKEQAKQIIKWLQEWIKEIEE